MAPYAPEQRHPAARCSRLRLRAEFENNHRQESRKIA